MGGISKSSLHQLEKAKEISSTYGVIVVLKGAYTRIITPHGLVNFNSTGNPGMAKGGTGDVLAGLLTGLLGQGLPAVSACLLGVFLHGLAGDMAANHFSQPAMTASNLIECLPKSWQAIIDYEKFNEKEQ
jgi:NAD(P)H-hydrate epimerase